MQAQGQGGGAGYLKRSRLVQSLDLPGEQEHAAVPERIARRGAALMQSEFLNTRTVTGKLTTSLDICKRKGKKKKTNGLERSKRAENRIERRARSPPVR